MAAQRLPIPGTFFQQVTPQQADVSQPWATSLEFYLTPWGFLKGAAENNATASRRRVDGKNYTVLTWSPAVKAPSGKNYVINGYVNDKNLVERVETWLGDNIMGDMHILATYTGWKDFGGVHGAVEDRADARRVAVLRSRCDGGDRPIPPMSQRWLLHLPAVAAARRRWGAGRWRPRRSGWRPAGATGADRHVRKARRRSLPAHHRSRQLRFADRGVQGPHHDARGRTDPRRVALAYIAEAKKLIPNKPIRYVMNTHPHADHTGGLPAMVAEGATIITQKNNEAFFEKALNTPRTLLNDTLAKNPKKAKIEAVSEKKVYSDGTRTGRDVPRLSGSSLERLDDRATSPRRRSSSRATSRCPLPGQPANDHVKALVPILEKLNLDFDRYINVHASATPQTKAELWKAVGK